LAWNFLVGFSVYLYADFSATVMSPVVT